MLLETKIFFYHTCFSEVNNRESGYKYMTAPFSRKMSAKVFIKYCRYNYTSIGALSIRYFFNSETAK